MYQLPIEMLIDARKRKYYNKLSKSDCFLLRYLFSNSAVNLLNTVNSKYNVLITDSDAKFNNMLWKIFYEGLN